MKLCPRTDLSDIEIVTVFLHFHFVVSTVLPFGPLSEPKQEKV